MSGRHWLTLALLATTAMPAAAQNFSNTIFFGDSNTNSGRYIYISFTNPPVNFANSNAGAYTTNPGPEWSVALGQRFGITVTPSSAPGGGNNYAAGGARVVYQDPARNAWSTASQIAAYLGTVGGHADPNALYVYWIGVNDLKTGTDAGFGSPGNIVNPADNTAIQTLGLQAAAQVASLHAAGAQYIVVPNTFSLKTAAAGVASGFGFSQTTTNSRALYDQTLWNGIAAQGINFVPADFNTLLNLVLLNPTQFGITTTSVATPACGLNLPSYNCTPANYVTPNADKTYFYADGPSSANVSGHVTSAVQKIEADYIYSLVVAPSQISFLAEAAVKSRTGIVNAIYNQIPLSFGQAGAFHGWVSGDVSWLKLTNYNGFPNDPGTPVAVTAGFDYRLSSSWLVGMAFSGGNTRQTFSNGGYYRQEESAASFYAAYNDGAWWANLVGTAGALRNDINRLVPLGITSETNLGHASGTNYSFAAELGYNFMQPVGEAQTAMAVKAPVAPAYFKHGPVAGIVLQRVRVDGFTESDPLGGISSLAFDLQTRNSTVTELGYQASIDLGRWQPFVKAV